MRGLVGLPLDVTRVLDDLVDSLDVLDLLALLCRDRSRTWTAESVSAELRIPRRIASRSLARLRSGGVLSVDATGACRFEPTDAQRATAILAVVDLLHTRRHELVNHVASRQLQRIQSIADSFRLRTPDSANGPARAGADRTAGAEPSRSLADEAEPAHTPLVPAWQRGG